MNKFFKDLVITGSGFNIGINEEFVSSEELGVLVESVLPKDYFVLNFAYDKSMGDT